ncbi:unnamed protein product [Effrenium voratum]|nr:unnamed protein product [Effrenium voratum]
MHVFPLDWPRGDELCSENRREHVEAFVRWFFDEKFESQLRPLAEGFKSVLGGSNLLKELVTAPQLEQFLCGVEAPMDLRQLRQSARFLGFDQGFEELFWSVLEELDAEQRRRFAVFVSACGRRPPEGWHKFDLQVQRNGEGDERLPTAYTCFTLLLLPRYSSAQVMRARLLAAINETEGFGLS